MTSLGVPTQSYAGEYELEFETPFVQTFATAYEGFGAEEHMAVTSPDERYVPFAVTQEASDGYGPAQSEDLAELLAELEHPGFNDAVSRLVNEATELYQEQFLGAPDGSGRAAVEPEQMLEAHFQPLVRATEGLLDEMAQEAARYDVATMSEGELEGLFDRYEPPRDVLPPNHEFWGPLADLGAQRPGPRAAPRRRRVGERRHQNPDGRGARAGLHGAGGGSRVPAHQEAVGLPRKLPLRRVVALPVRRIPRALDQPVRHRAPELAEVHRGPLAGRTPYLGEQEEDLQARSRRLALIGRRRGFNKFRPLYVAPRCPPSARTRRPRKGGTVVSTRCIRPQGRF